LEQLIKANSDGLFPLEEGVFAAKVNLGKKKAFCFYNCPSGFQEIIFFSDKEQILAKTLSWLLQFKPDLKTIINFISWTDDFPKSKRTIFVDQEKLEKSVQEFLQGA